MTSMVDWQYCDDSVNVTGIQSLVKKLDIYNPLSQKPIYHSVFVVDVYTKMALLNDSRISLTFYTNGLPSKPYRAATRSDREVYLIAAHTYDDYVIIMTEYEYYMRGILKDTKLKPAKFQFVKERPELKGGFDFESVFQSITGNHDSIREVAAYLDMHPQDLMKCLKKSIKMTDRDSQA